MNKKETKLSGTPENRKWEGSNEWKRWKEEMYRLKHRDWSKPPHLDPAMTEPLDEKTYLKEE